MFIRTDIPRTDLATLLNAEADKRDIRELHSSLLSASDVTNGIVALWGDEARPEQRAPSILLSSEPELRDLFAFVWTYLPDFRPLTAIVRVLDVPTLKAAASLPARPSLTQTRSAWLGLMFAEVVSDLHQKKGDSSRLALGECLGSMTFAHARAAALGYSSEWIPLITRAWNHLHAISIQSARGEESFVPPSFWELLHFVEGERSQSGLNFPPNRKLGSDFLPALMELGETGQVGTDLWNVLTRNRPGARQARALADAPREQRVLAFQHVALEIAQSKAKDESDAFVIAYLASQVSPGSMDHIHLLEGMPRDLRSAYYWYGVISGLAKGSKISTAFDGVGRRVLRELVRPESVFDRPNVDIDLAELIVGIESARAEPVRGAYPGILNVSILPGVSSVVQTHEIQGAGREMAGNAITADVTEQIRRLERALVEGRVSLERLSRSLGMGSQQSLRYPRSNRPK